MNEPLDEPVSHCEKPIRHVDQLTPGMAGRWLVTTHGSRHEWNLDAMTYMRIPGPGSPSGRFAHDGHRLAITRVADWPRIGASSLVFFDDPDDPLRTELWRRSSRITSITELAAVDPDTQPPS